MSGHDNGQASLATVRARVFKFNPEVDKEPHYETYEVPCSKEMRVLDVLEAIVEDLGHSLAYRWFCGVKKCGMCAVKVNGRPCLSCWEPALPEMTIEPLDNFPVIRDLVVDRDGYEKRLDKLNLRLDRGGEPYPGFPEPLRHSQMALTATMQSCIECLLCVSECPAYGTEFDGPAVLVQLARYALDPRDRGDRAKEALLAGLQNCVSCFSCSEACPAHIPILEEAIQGLRRQVTTKGYGPVAHHQKAVEALVLKQGLINPIRLMLRSRGLSGVVSEIPKALRLLRRGRFTLWQMVVGILGVDRQPKVGELARLDRKAKEEQW